MLGGGMSSAPLLKIAEEIPTVLDTTLWNELQQEQYIQQAHEGREPEGFTYDGALGTWSTAALEVCRSITRITGDFALSMGLQNNNYLTVHSIFRVGQCILDQAFEHGFIGGLLVDTSRKLQHILMNNALKNNV
eukprot:5291804-Karenia_brevis.AAC.1